MFDIVLNRVVYRKIFLCCFESTDTKRGKAIKRKSILISIVWPLDFFDFNFVFSFETENEKMSSTPSTPSELSSQSGSEKTPSSGTSCNKRAYTKTYNSPSLRAFNTFSELLGKLVDYVRRKIE